MNVFKHAWLWLRMTRRVGAYGYARKNGYTDQEARAYSDLHLPPTPDDVAFEEARRKRHRANSN